MYLPPEYVASQAGVRYASHWWHYGGDLLDPDDDPKCRDLSRPRPDARHP
jgi:hypothetical protein